MIIACLFGHKWDGCTCSKCGKHRNEQHDWDLCGEKCKRCGELQTPHHEWDGCTCSRCNKTRDEQHKWDGCKCVKCGRVKHSSLQKGKCISCREPGVKYIHQRVYEKEMIGGREITRSYSVEDRKCFHCDGQTPHLILLSDSSYKGKMREKPLSRKCIFCGEVDYCEKCKEYVPGIPEYNSYERDWTGNHRCPFCDSPVFHK